jgi:gliding motility-associated-like protein
MKKLLTLLLFSFAGLVAFAKHITGGEMYYTYLGRSGNDYMYHVVMKLYRDCFAPPDAAPLDPRANISVFNNETGASKDFKIDMKTSKSIPGDPDPCIDNPPQVCYQVGFYEFDISLPASTQGYTIAYQRCCRIGGINNLINSEFSGATYTAQIPGTNTLPTAPENNSAQFSTDDKDNTVIVCANNYFEYSFEAKDPDQSDRLVYYFCNAYTGGSQNSPAPDPPNGPPYNSVPYSAPYNSSSPLGSKVTINPNTGKITGIAPVAGIYVVTVCVDEYRNGVKIATQRKDFQIKVGDCSRTKPVLEPEFITCDGYTLNFANQNSSSLIHSYTWSFGDGNSSTQATPSNTYQDTGTYLVKLVVNKGELCSDSTTALAKVYPGFYPGFTYSGICINKPTVFTDTSLTKYGFINSWTWDFGDPATNSDAATIKNPTYTYTQMGIMNAQLIVTSNKGCIDTVTVPINIIDKPPIQLAFKDTLICRGDQVPLQASGQGSFSWTPLTNISNPNVPDPTVDPPSTTKYIVQLDNNGCINHDTVQVRVVDFVTLKANPDTVICAGDIIHLGAVTDGLKFNWTPADGLNDPTLLNAIAQPPATTTYQLTATIGGCQATDDMKVTLVPYPGAAAGADTVICFNSTAQLHGSIKGISYSWSPASSLVNPNSLNPIAKPRFTTSYVLTVYDNIGCPKPGRDTVVVTVLPKVNAFAGRDTSVVVGQPLQFNASGGIGYEWSPPTSLNFNNVNNPVAIYNGSFDSIKYKVVVTDEAGCADSSFVRVKIFKTNPQIFVPTAFTPNGDGHNDIFRPIAVGITKLEYFSVYNRWGELVFTTTVNGKGWDGKVGNKEQNSGTFVWMVKGVDYTGRVVTAKGTVTLIR